MGGVKDKLGNLIFVVNAECPLHGMPVVRNDNLLVAAY